MAADTKMQVRCTDQEKALWAGVAGGEGNLSDWVRTQLNAAATPPTEKVPHIPNLGDGDVVRDPVDGTLYRVFRIQETLQSAFVPGALDGQVRVAAAWPEETETDQETQDDLTSADLPTTQDDPGHSVRVEAGQDGPSADEGALGTEGMLAAAEAAKTITVTTAGMDPNSLRERFWRGETAETLRHKYDSIVNVDKPPFAEWLMSRAVDPDDDTAPDPEDPVDLTQQVEPVIPPAPVVPPVAHDEPLSPTCVNAVHHWKLAQGDRCRFCQGVA